LLEQLRAELRADSDEPEGKRAAGEK
jgi:hypothetical protein